jgi:hypothetical protein
MVVFKNKSWTMVPDFPCSKYDDNAPYWVEDNSKIANFIINSNGHFKITKTDETGKILSIEEYYPIEELKENKKQEINQACSSLIYSGYDYNGEHYDLSDEDQINMLAWSSVAQQGNSVPYHSSGNPCRTYTSEEFLSLVAAITSFKTYNLTYCNLLKQQVDEMTNSEEVKVVVYGVTKLNEKYQEIMNTILGGQNETIS